MYRLVYSKEGLIRFISHLDLIRLWQRAFRRAALPVKMTEGFTPHPVMSFGPPLPVGVAGRREVMDFSLASFRAPDTIKKDINSVLPAGVRVLEVKRESHSKRPDYKRLDTAVYEVNIDKARFNEAARKFADCIAAERIVLTKQTKKGLRTRNIRSLIRDIRVGGNGEGEGKIMFSVGIGEEGNLNCYDLLQAVLKWPAEEIRKLPVARLSLTSKKSLI